MAMIPKKLESEAEMVASAPHPAEPLYDSPKSPSRVAAWSERISEYFANKLSITIVLVGPETWKRKYVDWEIRSTLHEKHALLGLALHNAPRSWDGKVTVPDRLHHHVVSGFAHFMELSSVVGPAGLKVAIEVAIAKSKNTEHIDNSFPKMFRNRS